MYYKSQQLHADLALWHQVAAATQNQALSAILFLYKVVLQQNIGWIEDVVRAKKPKKLPVVLSREEVKAVLQQVSGPTWLMMSLLYGAGLRLMECLCLRTKDVDFTYRQITVRQVGRGNTTASPGCRGAVLAGGLCRARRRASRALPGVWTVVGMPWHGGTA